MGCYAGFCLITPHTRIGFLCRHDWVSIQEHTTVLLEKASAVKKQNFTNCPWGSQKKREKKERKVYLK